MTTKMLPCPFCGSTDIDPTGWANSEGVEGPVCNSCTASIGTVGRTTEANIAAWNVRVYSEVLVELETARSIIVDLEGWSPDSENVKSIDDAIARAKGSVSPNSLEETYSAALHAARRFDDAANVEETNWTGWGEQTVPFKAEWRRVKAGQAADALRDADPAMRDRLGL